MSCVAVRRQCPMVFRATHTTDEIGVKLVTTASRIHLRIVTVIGSLKTRGMTSLMHLIIAPPANQVTTSADKNDEEPITKSESRNKQRYEFLELSVTEGVYRSGSTSSSNAFPMIII